MAPSRAASSSCSSSFLSSVLSAARRYKFNGNNLVILQQNLSKTRSVRFHALTLQHAFNLSTLGNVFRYLGHSVDDRSASVVLKKQHYNLLNSKISIQHSVSIQSPISVRLSVSNQYSACRRVVMFVKNEAVHINMTQLYNTYVSDHLKQTDSQCAELIFNTIIIIRLHQ